MNPSKTFLMLRAIALGAFVLGLAIPCFASPIMVEKNLFSPDRKPPPPDGESTTTASSTPATPPKALQLDGIFFHGSTRKALVRIKGQMPGKDKTGESSPFVSVREGDKISDYVVNKIGTKSIFVEKGGQTFELYLYAAGKVLPPMAAPAPPPANPNVGPGGTMPGEPRGRHGQAPQPGIPGGDGVSSDIGATDAAQQPPRAARGRQVRQARQATQPADDEMFDEMDETEDMGEE